MAVIKSHHPPGIIAVPTGSIGRYREFDIQLIQMHAPAGSLLTYKMGLNVARNINDAIRAMAPEHEWVFILGDDHTFAPDVLMKLLDHNVDVAVPLVLHRSPPYMPVLYGPGPDYVHVKPSWFKGKRGLVDISEFTVGNAGMLVRRKVFETLSDPWFEMGKTHPEVGGSDLYFSEKVRRAGIKQYMDMDLAMGHIGHVAFWPGWDADGTLLMQIRPPDNFDPIHREEPPQ